MVEFRDVFGEEKSIFGMIHLAGRGYQEKIERALKEIELYKRGDLQGAIVEDYHGDVRDVETVLSYISGSSFDFKIGINVLSDPYFAFELANMYGASFVQFDTIQASPGSSRNNHRFNEEKYLSMREKYPNVAVIGGVRFKYVPPTGRSLEEDLKDGMSRCEAVCTTGEGTGRETPLEKLQSFREIMGDFPLVVGAGVTAENAQEQLRVADGAVVGSYFKNGDTEITVKRSLVRNFMDKVRDMDS